MWRIVQCKAFYCLGSRKKWDIFFFGSTAVLLISMKFLTLGMLTELNVAIASVSYIQVY